MTIQYRVINMTVIGEKYSKMEIVSEKYIKDENKRKPFVMAKCDCGNTKEVQYYNLKSGNTKSCSICPSDVLLAEIGKQYAHWTILSLSRSDRFDKRYVIANCAVCNTNKEVSLAALRNGSSKSCGCGLTTHQMIHTRIYSIWCGIIQRCNNPNNTAYDSYGGRGISVCDDWLMFENFYKDMGTSYQDTLTIDRIDYNGNYCKENCKWSTKLDQGRNTRTVKLSVEIALIIKQRRANGESNRQIAKDYDCHHTAIYNCVRGKTWS